MPSGTYYAGRNRNAAGAQPGRGDGPVKADHVYAIRAGDALSFITSVIGFGAMIGRFLEHSRGGRVLADWMLEKFGRDQAQGLF